MRRYLLSKATTKNNSCKRYFSSSNNIASTTKRINLWTQPRSSSTSLMYSFKARGDCSVVDEPLYAHFVQETNVYRPYREELFNSQSTNLQTVKNDVLFNDDKYDTNLVFFKHMGKQLLPSTDWAWILNCHNVILLRHPRDVLASFNAGLSSSSSSIDIDAKSESGVIDLYNIYNYVTSNNNNISVILQDDLLNNPEGTLKSLCQELGIDFVKSMLKWKKGGIEEDGVWASTWYHSSHNSTSFTPPSKPFEFKTLPENMEEILKSDLIEPFNELKKQKLKPLAVLPDERNENIKIHVGGELLNRSDAKISVFDSVVQGGDAVW